MFNKPKKSLGQNFLKSDKIAQEIVSSGEVCAEDIVLEVGPGEGMLTKELVKKAKKVIAVEKDEQLVEFLKEKFAKEISDCKLEIVSEDILKFNPSDHQLSAGGYKIVANIPYYITSYFLRTFLESDHQPSLMVLMVQKEVAERIAGVKREAKQNFSRLTHGEAGKLTSLRTDKEGNPTEVKFSSFSKESLLSISVKAYGEPKIIRKVSAGFFSPSPKVDSAVLKISNISKKFFQDISEKKFFET
ncbi:MAG: rRNA adenine dimethyltransferase family protein, partial [Patescibacteria group bacterium]